jgi:hypothetical protein
MKDQQTIRRFRRESPATCVLAGNSKFNSKSDSMLDSMFGSMLDPMFGSMLDPMFGSMLDPMFGSMLDPMFGSMLDPMLDSKFAHGFSRGGRRSWMQNPKPFQRFRAGIAGHVPARFPGTPPKKPSFDGVPSDFECTSQRRKDSIHPPSKQHIQSAMQICGV